MKIMLGSNLKISRVPLANLYAPINELIFLLSFL